MNETTVTLGTKNYTIKQLSIRANRKWRNRFNEPVDKLLSAFQEVGQVSTTEFEDGKELVQKIGGLLLARATEVAGVLLQSMDLVLDGLFAYSPELEADRDTIEENATDDEAMKAFVEVLKLAYPFGRLLNLAGQIGQTDKETSQNSAEPSGE
jgi:hypothetical protein